MKILRMMTTSRLQTPQVGSHVASGGRVRVWLPALFLFPCGVALAETTTQSATGIPIEWLFGVIVALVGLVYGDIKRELRSSHTERHEMAKEIKTLTAKVTRVQERLRIGYRHGDAIEDEDGP